MIISGQVLPQSGIVLSGQHDIGSVITIDDDAMAFAGTFAAPAIKPMIARSDKNRFKTIRIAMRL